jgi:hypothetical protein
MYECAYCRREFHNVLWKSPQNRAVCANCAVLEKREATFAPDDREVPKKAPPEAQKA